MEVNDDKRSNDSALVAAALAGGPEAFGVIVERYQDAVFAVVLARLRRFHDAEDVTQVVFVEAYERLDKLKDPNRLGAWLRSIAIHKSIDHLRRRKDMAQIDGAEDEHASVSSWRAENGRRELREEVMAAIGRLSKTQRETTTLYYINGYSLEEVASIQEVPAGTVARRLHDARKKLKEEMVGMVERVLKSEAPKEDFGKRVVSVLYRTGLGGILDEAKRSGDTSPAGFIDGLRSARHSATRAFAAKLIETSEEGPEAAVAFLKKALGDRNKKVRASAVRALLGAWSQPRRRIAGVNGQRIRREIVPLVVPLMKDRSRTVRLVAYNALGGWAADVPLEVVAAAVAREADTENVPYHWARLPVAALELLEAVLAAREVQRDIE